MLWIWTMDYGLWTTDVNTHLITQIDSNYKDLS